MKYIKFTSLALLFFSGDIKKNNKKKLYKKSSENDQLTGHFQSFFFRPPDPKSEKNSRKSTIKKILPKSHNAQ